MLEQQLCPDFDVLHKSPAEFVGNRFLFEHKKATITSKHESFINRLLKQHDKKG